MRTTLPLASLATQSASAPAAIAVGLAPTGIAFPGLPRSRSMGVTVPSTALATHTAPNAETTPLGALPTSIVVKTLLVPGSICETPRRSPLATHSDPSPNARADGSAPMSMVVIWRVSASTRDTVPARWFATHTEPAPTAAAIGPRPTANCSDSAPLSGSIRPTEFSSIVEGPSLPVLSTTAAMATASSRAPPSATSMPPRRRRRSTATGPLAGGASIAGSWVRMERSSCWSREPGSSPSSSSSVRLRIAVALERLYLAPRPVEREHELFAQSLACRMLSYERLELGDQLSVMAERQVGLGAVLERDQAQLLQPSCLVLRKGLVGEVRQRRPAPQGERGGQRLVRTSGVAVVERLTSLVRESPEPVGVQGAAVELQCVTPTARDEHAVAERLAQARDVYLDRLGRPVRRPLAPQLVHDPVNGDDLAAVDQQDRQDLALLRSTERYLPRAGQDLQRAKYLKFHERICALPTFDPSLHRVPFASLLPLSAGCLPP